MSHTESTTQPSLAAQIEAVLFVHGDPVSVAKLAKITGTTPEEISAAVVALRAIYESTDRGLAIVENNDTVQLATAPICADIIDRMTSDSLQEDLSQSALEVLSIVAYRGPVSRMDIDAIRGVNCAFVLRNLMIRGLVERIMHPDNTRAYLYRVTNDFLTHLGLLCVEDLPDFAKLRDHEKINAVLPMESDDKDVS
jgi:segregation and condensation protein B